MVSHTIHGTICIFYLHLPTYISQHMDGMGMCCSVFFVPGPFSKCEPKSIEKWDRVEVELASVFARDIQRFSEKLWTPKEIIPKIPEKYPPS